VTTRQRIRRGEGPASGTDQRSAPADSAATGGSRSGDAAASASRSAASMRAGLLASTSNAASSATRFASGTRWCLPKMSWYSGAIP